MNDLQRLQKELKFLSKLSDEVVQLQSGSTRIQIVETKIALLKLINAKTEELTYGSQTEQSRVGGGEETVVYRLLPGAAEVGVCR